MTLFYNKIFSIPTTRAFQNHCLLTKTVEPTDPTMRERAAQYWPSALQGRNLGQQRKITAHYIYIHLYTFNKVKSLMKVYKTSIVHKDVDAIFSMFTTIVHCGLGYAKIILPDITSQFIHHQSSTGLKFPQES